MAFTFGLAKNAKDTDMNFEPLKPGIYTFQIENVQIQDYPGSEKIQPCKRLHIQLRTDLDDGHTRKVWDDIYMDATNNYSMNKLKKIVESCEISLDDSAEEKEIADSLVGEICTAEIVIHEWNNGKKANQVNKYIVKKEPEVEPEPEPAPKPVKKPKTGAKITIVKEEDLPF